MTELQDHSVIKNTDTVCHSGIKEEGRPGSGEFGKSLGEKLPIGGLGWGEERILFFSPFTRRTSNSSRRKPGGGGLRNDSHKLLSRLAAFLPHTEGEAQ